MNIVLLGASGRTGRKVLVGALGAGDRVTALVRAEGKLADLSHERLDVRVGSACDPRVLAALLPGHDVVISTLGPRRPTKAAAAVYSDSARAIVGAMEGSDVDRLLVTSSALLFPSGRLRDRALRGLVRSVVQEARRMEELICASSLDWTIARTGFLTDDASTAYRQAEGALPEGGGSISRAAVARFLLTAARQSAHRRQVVGLSA
ncbi:MAG: NAD(P)H-binding protein [Rhodospirillales bacterium]|nr:NAD(P)H-binding protein [Rhodospirillales bacterium]MDE0378457.1 NAD(P)H-binding protein [Rhodospirillales bacterium]